MLGRNNFAVTSRRIGCRVCITLAVIVASLHGCIRSTPFGTEPRDTDLTAKNLARLAALEPAPFPFKFVALGDTHDAYDELADAVRRINARDDVSFVLHAGDISDLGLLNEMEWTQAQLEDLRVPVLTVIGNHDAIGKGADIYQKMYGPLNYSFVFGNTKFILFNSNTLEFPSSAPNRPWLEQETADAEGAQRKIWVTHQNVEAPDDLPSGTARDFYAGLLATGAVDLVIHGHLESYDLRSNGQVPLLQCSTFERKFYVTIVTVAESGLSFERCRFGVCEVVTP